VGIQVWVDPPRSVMLEFDQLNRNFSQELEKMVKKTEDRGRKTGKGSEKKPNPVMRLQSWLTVVMKHPQDEHFKGATESYRRALYAWYARLWSQSPDPGTHWTVDELEKINDQNPQFYEWLCRSSWALIEKHREDVKKGYRGPSEKLPAPAQPATPSSKPTI
jgi:hypothetical protein